MRKEKKTHAHTKLILYKCKATAHVQGYGAVGPGLNVFFSYGTFKPKLSGAVHIELT